MIDILLAKRASTAWFWANAEVCASAGVADDRFIGALGGAALCDDEREKSQESAILLLRGLNRV
jgi:hypothetical protein